MWLFAYYLHSGHIYSWRLIHVYQSPSLWFAGPLYMYIFVYIIQLQMKYQKAMTTFCEEICHNWRLKVPLWPDLFLYCIIPCNMAKCIITCIDRTHVTVYLASGDIRISLCAQRIWKSGFNSFIYSAPQAFGGSIPRPTISRTLSNHNLEAFSLKAMESCCCTQCVTKI